MDQVKVDFLVPDTPTKCPLQPDNFLKIAQRVVRSYGVHNNAFMDRQMDGWMDSMLIAISPKPLGRRIMKFNKRSSWYSYINLDAFFFFLLLYEISKSVTLTSRSYQGMGMMLSKTLDLYLPTCKI